MIMVAPNGARRTKNDHPAIPLTGPEIAAETVACAQAGASVLHLHVRNNDGQHTINPDAYRQMLEHVGTVAGRTMVIQITTEACGIYSPQEQMDMVRRVRPEAVSLAMSEILPAGGDEGQVADFLSWLRSEKIAPQFILYTTEDVRSFLNLRERGIVPFTRPFLLFVLGRYLTDRASNPDDLEPFREALGDVDLPWSMCAFGKNENACVGAAVAAGGHVRVGFENNIWRADGSLADSNCELVRNAADVVGAHGRTVMTADEARKFLAQTSM